MSFREMLPFGLDKVAKDGNKALVRRVTGLKMEKGAVQILTKGKKAVRVKTDDVLVSEKGELKRIPREDGRKVDLFGKAAVCSVNGNAKQVVCVDAGSLDGTGFFSKLRETVFHKFGI